MWFELEVILVTDTILSSNMRASALPRDKRTFVVGIDL